MASIDEEYSGCTSPRVGVQTSTRLRFTVDRARRAYPRRRFSSSPVSARAAAYSLSPKPFTQRRAIAGVAS